MWLAGWLSYRCGLSIVDRTVYQICGCKARRRQPAAWWMIESGRSAAKVIKNKTSSKRKSLVSVARGIFHQAKQKYYTDDEQSKIIYSLPTRKSRFRCWKDLHKESHFSLCNPLLNTFAPDFLFTMCADLPSILIVTPSPTLYHGKRSRFRCWKDLHKWSSRFSLRNLCFERVCSLALCLLCTLVSLPHQSRPPCILGVERICINEGILVCVTLFWTCLPCPILCLLCTLAFLPH